MTHRRRTRPAEMSGRYVYDVNPVDGAGRGDVPNARLMLKHGADIDALDDQYHGTPLAWAARKGHEDMVRFLLSDGANSALPRDLPPATPRARARAAGHEGIVSILDEASR